MVLKRHLFEGGEDGSEFPSRNFKRRPAFAYSSILRNVNRNSLHELGPILEPLIRNWVRDEVQRAISSSLRSSLIQSSSPGSRTFQLDFEDQLPSMIFTGSRLESERGSPIKIILRDSSSRNIITSGPLSSSKVNIVVLDGDFNIDEREDWGEAEFNYKRVREREGRRPLVTGILSVALREGVGYADDITFTDNSSWVRCGKFRLGAEMQNITSEGSVREAISNAFKVKDHRGESYRKHHPPRMFDEVWRLEKIAKDGASHKRLADHGVSTVKEFLRLYVTKPNYLRHILGGKISNKSWDTIIKHAIASKLDKNELYMYKGEAGIVLVFDSIYQVAGAIFYGQNYQSQDTFNQYQKQLVDNLKLRVYENLSELVPISDQSAIDRSLLLPSLQANSDCSPSSSLHNINFPVEQDEMEFHMNSEQITVSPTHGYGVQGGNQFQFSVAGTSHPMEDFSSMLCNGFATGDASAGWDGSVSMAPLGMTDSLALNENFQVDTPAWQGNSFFVTPRNQAELDLVSSNFGIRFSGIGKSKASWCKIRAVIKWRMVKSSCQKKAKKF
ncbi:hypothetical protein M9H77_27403 [Catharanthus roseus]|uniref:Uncharacterized protein n=1 Tax=Catharanthus roseus TaxID=4058 RepID=A0ACC0AEA3_CATRO|nr:hypothetical protein M9H77_27403 [Catharanthus roseus]